MEAIAHTKQFEERAGVSFRDKRLLAQAFVHRSYINEHRNSGFTHNERLEFLGDAVLELVVTDELYNRFPEKPEGELTALRSALVNTHSLALIAGDLRMDDFLLLSKGEARDTGRARQFILANTFEAFIGAVYVDQGYDAAQQFVSRFLFPRIVEILEKRLWQDAKSRFQELAQEHKSETPHYETVSETGPDHDKRFTVAVYIGTDEIARGEGNAKQEAEQEAAQNALTALDWA